MDEVLELVERSNQRGGRMLSVVDLLAAETLTLAQAAWLLARVEAGSGWLVGARPGGAGKTAIMSALLAMLPAGERVRLAHPGTGWEAAAPGECVVAYEIGAGRYDAYVWGADVRRLTELGRAGCRIVSNLHADTLAEARAQVVEQCGATPAGLAAFGVFLPITITGTPRRRVVRELHQAAGDGAWAPVALPATPPAREAAIAAFLADCAARRVIRVEDVRPAWLAWCDVHRGSSQL